MGSSNCCESKPRCNIVKLAYPPVRHACQPPPPADASKLVCTELSHVESLLAHLPPSVHAELEDPKFQYRCHATFNDIQKRRPEAERPGFLEGEDLVEAVHRSVPEHFLKSRLGDVDLKKMMLAFDTNSDGRISEDEFDMFCMWAIAMDVMGFFAGTCPFSKIADVLEPARYKNLLIVSEFLDPEHVLGECVLPSTLCTYYHPDGLTLDEFSEQIRAAAHVRTMHGCFFESVALANHGPDEHGIWNVCSDRPVSLESMETAMPRLMPMFKALAAMVASPTYAGHVDLLACCFAANPTGVECIKLIEKQVNAKFSASTDETGNVAHGGNWELELGGRNVAPIYFQEEKLGYFTKVMKIAKPHPKPEAVKGHPMEHCNEKSLKKPPVRVKPVRVLPEDPEDEFI